MTCNVGDTVCHCTLIQKCGTGAYGEVWLAEDSIGARVALKILKGTYSARELAGLKNYKNCNHPNLLKIRYVEISEGQICYTMDAADDLNHGSGEYLADTLANRLSKSGRLDGKQILYMLDDLLAGLEELHRNGLVHRDIKPDNILWVNGRATLADVGLITVEGAGSLVGSPGFLSPRILEGHPAEACDDFYALGKVIYCAMTGLPVTEYPSLPPEMTISVDANLNKALRESCSNPVKTSADFRKLLTGKQNNIPGKDLSGIKNTWERIPLKKISFPLLVLSALSAAIFFAVREKTEDKQMISQSETGKTEKNPRQFTDFENESPEDKKIRAQINKIQNVEKDFNQYLQKKVLQMLESSGWLNDGSKLSPLLEHKPLKTQDILNLILNGTGTPRVAYDSIHKVNKYRQSTILEVRLLHFVAPMIGRLNADNVRKRQNYWKSQPGSPEEKVKQMLSSDLQMQAVAFDIMVCDKINDILKNNKFSAEEESELKKLMTMRLELINSAWGIMQYMTKNKILDIEK